MNIISICEESEFLFYRKYTNIVLAHIFIKLKENPYKHTFRFVGKEFIKHYGLQGNSLSVSLKQAVKEIRKMECVKSVEHKHQSVIVNFKRHINPDYIELYSNLLVGNLFYVRDVFTMRWMLFLTSLKVKGVTEFVENVDIIKNALNFKTLNRYQFIQKIKRTQQTLMRVSNINFVFEIIREKREIKSLNINIVSNKNIRNIEIMVGKNIVPQ